MSVSTPVKFWWMVVIAVVSVVMSATIVLTQQRGGTPQTDKAQPVNSGANPYRVIRDWAQLNSEGIA